MSEDILVTFRLPKDLKESFEKFCSDRKLTVSEVLRRLIADELWREVFAQECMRKEREEILKLKEKIERGVKE